MAGFAENQMTPSPNQGKALPKVVQITAVLLLVYSLATFSLGLFLPIWAYNTERGLGFIVVPFYILIGLVIMLISFGLFEGGYQLLRSKSYGASVGMAATICSLFPGAVVVYALSAGCFEEMGLERCGVQQVSVIILFTLFCIFLVRGLVKSGKILKRE